MRKFEKFLLRGAGYTLLILSLYFLVSIIASPIDGRISGGKFFLILCFGLVIALTEFIYSLLTVKFWLKTLLHYSILLSTFILIFIPLLGVKSNGPASIAAWIVIFTVLYAVLTVAAHFIRKGINKVDDAIDRRTTNNEAVEYTPMFDKED